MEPRKKNLLIRQISAQAETMKQQSDSELAFSSVNLCAALLEAANSAAPAMSDEEMKNLFLSFSGINQQLAAFFELVCGKTQVNEELQASVRHRQALQQDVAVQQGLLNDTREDIQKLQAELQSDRDSLIQMEEAFQAAEEQRRKLLAALQEYTPDKIARLQQGNLQYSQQIDEARVKKAALEKDKNDLAATLQKLNAEINAFPEQARALEQEYAEKQKQLDRLRELDRLYSPERRAELEAEQKKLQDAVTENQRVVQSLKTRINSLNVQADTLDNERQECGDELLERLEHAMQGVQHELKEREARLAEVRVTAETLRKNLEACLTEGRQLHDWLDTDVTPLDAMTHALDRTEANELRRTLDPGRIGRIQTLRTEIRERLDALDQILDICSRAAGLDQAAVDRMSGRRI